MLAGEINGEQLRWQLCGVRKFVQRALLRGEELGQLRVAERILEVLGQAEPPWPGDAQRRDEVIDGVVRRSDQRRCHLTKVPQL